MKAQIAVAVVMCLAISGLVVAEEKEADTVDFSILLRADSTPGSLDGSATFDRRFGAVYDGTCNATSSDSSANGVAYQVFAIHSPVAEALVAEVALGTLSDSLLFLYCDPFDPLAPAANLVANDDDDGAGLGSAFLPADGYMIEADTTYYLVVSAFSTGATGTFTLNLSGNAVLGAAQQPTPTVPPPTATPQGATPVPTTSRTGVIVLVMLVAVAAFVILRRRLG